MSLVGLASLAACGDVAARSARPSAPVETVSAPTIRRAASVASPVPEPIHVAATPAAADPATVSPSPPVGALEGHHSLGRLFESLLALEEGRAHDDVRIVQYGDSHTASDLGTAVVRRALQGRFGDGGRGFVAIGKPWKRFVQDGIRGEMNAEFEPQKTKYLHGAFLGDGRYGIAGVGIGATKAGASAKTTIAAPASRIEIAYDERPAGGTFEVYVDGSRAARVGTKGSVTQSAYRVFDVPEAPHEVEVRAVGDGDVRIFGMALDRPRAGVVLDALGINGAQIFTLLRLDEAHMAEQLRHRAPTAFVLAYGTNESLESFAPAEYERKLVDLLGRFARAVPSASCLLLGPPDRATKPASRKSASKKRDGDEDEWVTAPKLVEIVASQRKVAQAAGCAFFDQYQAMGGAGSMARWSKETPPRGGRDRVHLTKEGYAELGAAFASDLVRAYAQWKAERAHSTGSPVADRGLR